MGTKEVQMKRQSSLPQSLNALVPRDLPRTLILLQIQIILNILLVWQLKFRIILPPLWQQIVLIPLAQRLGTIVTLI